jgi:hypothetical protein
MERHPIDLLSLISGSLVLGLGLLLLSGGLSGLPMEWAGPAVAIGLGVLILVAVRPERRPNKDDPSPTDEK